MHIERGVKTVGILSFLLHPLFRADLAIHPLAINQG